MATAKSKAAVSKSRTKRTADTDAVEEVLSAKETFEQMETPQLVKLCNLMYGLNVNKDYEHARLVDMILKAQAKFKGNEEITILEDDDTGTKVPKGYCKIRLQPGKHNQKMRPAIVGHNFVMTSLPVNKDIIVPNKYLNCLQDAEQTVYYTDVETGDWIETSELVYPFSILERG